MLSLLLLVLPLRALAAPPTPPQPLPPTDVEPCRSYWTYTGSKTDCEGVGLTELPRFVEPTSQLLELSSNNLTALRNGSFSALGLSALEFLHADSNAIATIEPDAFRGLLLLRTVRLADNRLRNLHSETFRHNPKLQELFLDGNPLVIPSDGTPLLRAPLLLVLHLSRCGLTSLPPRALRGLPQLRALVLAGNRLRTLDQAPFAAASSLLFLDLSANRLRDLSPASFAGLTLLRRLDLTANQLRAPPLAAFRPLRALARLELGDNPLECDCTLRPIFDWAAGRHLSVRAVCSDGAAWVLLGNLDCPA